MNDLLVQCTKCGFSFSADESHIGLATTCASCAKEFVMEIAEKNHNPEFPNQLRPDQIQVTSGEIRKAHEIIGMICFTVGTRGDLRNHFESLISALPPHDWLH